MSIIHVTGSGTGKGSSTISDRSPFYGGQIPSEVKALIKPLKKLEKPIFRTLLQWIVGAMEGKTFEYEQFRELCNNAMTEEDLSIIYMGLFTLLKAAIRLPKSSLKIEFFKEDLKEIQIPDQFHEDLASVVFGSRRPKIDEEIISSRPRLPKLEQFRWRVDVAISTSVLNRVLEPSILMEMTLSDGKLHSFEVPVSKFHELRYSVAHVLKEMEDLEKRSILKIQD